MDDLKSCPFCGCDNVVILYDHPESVGPSIGGGFYISHPLWRNYPQSWGCQAVPSNGYFQTEQEAIAAWNRRATEADLLAEVERLRAEKAAIGQAVQIMFETSKGEIDRLTRHLVAIAERSEEVSKAGGATNYARAAISPKPDGGQDV